jgi:predicted SnoaL-like aldol condensation-catalyzing enzyme
MVRDGRQALVEYHEAMARQYPRQAKVGRVLADGDHVMLHVQLAWPGLGDCAAVHIFRLDEAGKIVEHWDVLQRIPAQPPHGNPVV